MGKKKTPFYRIVAADSRRARDGRFIEMLGYYNPMTDPEDVKLDYDKIYKWLDRGAQPTDIVENLLRKAGLLERWRLLKEGVKITELDAVIEERRKKQPKKKPKIDKVKKVVEDPKEDELEKAEEEKEEKKSVKSEKADEPVAEGEKAEKKTEEKAETDMKDKIETKEDKIETKEEAVQESDIPKNSEESSKVEDETKEG
jgi:small subunit ribosomal protein S16